MGEVYLAHDTTLRRSVALKVLPGDVTAAPDRMKRFEHEARSASGLNHPNIITIYDIDQSDGVPFIAAEFIEGSTLRERMRSGRLSIAESLDVAIQIASALAAAHAAGIVHRDIKPENVMLRSDGIAKVVDFGLAKLSGADALKQLPTNVATATQFKTESGVVMGTAHYMSPEQSGGLEVDARTDIFSLGVVMHEMLTARLPFEGSLGAADVPAELERIVSKSLRTNRDERYQTAKDLLLDLQSLKRQLESGPIPARSTPRRWPLVGAVAVLLLLIAGAIFYTRWQQPPAAAEAEIKSLAVLPLKSLDAGDNYLGLGIADAAIGKVSQTGKMIVRPTSAVRRYLNDDTDALGAAKQLGVDSILEGSFQRAGDRLRVRVNLLRSRDGASLWTDSFEFQMADIFTVQDTVAQQVVSRLRLQLDASERAKLTKRYTSNPVAYDFYLRGTFAFDQRLATADVAASLKNAIDLLTKATEADPGFARAHAQLAYVYAVRAVFMKPTEPLWVQRAQEEIKSAEALDPQLADTHLARFQLLYSQFEGYQGDAAVRELRAANQLDPSVGHAELAYMYAHLGLEDLTARELARATEIDPTSDTIRQTAVLMYEVQSKYDDYAANRDLPHDGRSEALYFMERGRLDDAQRIVDDWSATQPNNPQLLPTKALLLARKGDFKGAETLIPIILKAHPLKDPLYHHAAYDFACVYALQGKSSEAVKWLREAAITGYHLYPRYVRDSYLDKIRQSPEFIQFLAEMKAENERYRREFS